MASGTTSQGLRRDYQYCLGYREGRGGIVEGFEIAHLERFSLEMFSHFTSDDYFCVLKVYTVRY